MMHTIFEFSSESCYRIARAWLGKPQAVHQAQPTRV